MILEGERERQARPPCGCLEQLELQSDMLGGITNYRALQMLGVCSTT